MVSLILQNPNSKLNDLYWNGTNGFKSNDNRNNENDRYVRNSLPVIHFYLETIHIVLCFKLRKELDIQRMQWVPIRGNS